MIRGCVGMFIFVVAYAMVPIWKSPIVERDQKWFTFQPSHLKKSSNCAQQIIKKGSLDLKAELDYTPLGTF